MHAESLVKLFQMTNEIRCFDRIKDMNIIQSLKDKDGCICFNEERLIILGRKTE